MTLFRHKNIVHCNSDFCELWRFCGSNMNRHFFNADWACARSVCKCGTDASTVFLRTQCLADFKMKWMRPFIETCINLFCSSFSQIAIDPDVVTMALLVTDDRKPEDRVAFINAAFALLKRNVILMWHCFHGYHVDYVISCVTMQPFLSNPYPHTL